MVKYPLRDAGAKLEPALAMAFMRSVERMRTPLQITAIAVALSGKDAKTALRHTGAALVDEAMAPMRTVVQEAVLRGGRIGADMVNEALEAR